MARLAQRRQTKRAKTNQAVEAYRYDQRRKNNPPAGIATTYEVRDERKTKTYRYDPYLDPQLIWSEKAGLKAKWEDIWDADKTSFDVDVVSLHVHERVSTQAIIQAVKRNGQKPREQQLELFADPQLPLSKIVEFYRHDVDWANRLILGDSLLVTNSHHKLAPRQGRHGWQGADDLRGPALRDQVRLQLPAPH